MVRLFLPLLAFAFLAGQTPRTVLPEAVAIVAQTGSLPYRGLVIRGSLAITAPADSQSAKQQTDCLRHINA